MMYGVGSLTSRYDALRFLEQAFAEFEGRRLVDSFYTTASKVVAACVKFHINEYGGLELEELKQQAAYLGRINYTVQRDYSARVKWAKEIMPGIDELFGNTPHTEVVTTSFVSASGYRRLRAELRLNDEFGSGELNDTGFKTRFTGTVLAADLHLDAYVENARQPTASHWQTRESWLYTGYAKLLANDFAEGGFDAFDARLRLLWVALTARNCQNPISQSTLRMRWRLHRGAMVMAFDARNSIIAAGVWGDSYSANNGITDVQIGDQWLPVSTICELFPSSLTPQLAQ